MSTIKELVYPKRYVKLKHNGRIQKFMVLDNDDTLTEGDLHYISDSDFIFNVGRRGKNRKKRTVSQLKSYEIEELVGVNKIHPVSSFGDIVSEFSEYRVFLRPVNTIGDKI